MEAHLNGISKLRSQGLSVRAIAERLAKMGIEVDHNAVQRFCQKHGIALAKPVPYVSFRAGTQPRGSETSPREPFAANAQSETASSAGPLGTSPLAP